MTACAEITLNHFTLYRYSCYVSVKNCRLHMIMHVQHIGKNKILKRDIMSSVYRKCQCAAQATLPSI